MLNVTIVGTEWDIWDLTSDDVRFISLTWGYSLYITLPSICGEYLFTPVLRIHPGTYLN